MPFLLLSKSIQFQSPQNYYEVPPYCELEIFGRYKTSKKYWGLVDTGADYLLLNQNIMKILSLRVDDTKTKAIYSANGVADEYWITTVMVRAFGCANLVDAVIPKDTNINPQRVLIGRTTIQRLMNFGMTGREWYYE